jgi:prevent-host-death family protein
MAESRRPGDTVGLAAFKTHLSAYLRRVRRGEPLTILSRDVPIARVLPWTEGPVASRPARRRLQSVVLPPPEAGGAPQHGDSLAALVEERRERR